MINCDVWFDTTRQPIFIMEYEAGALHFVKINKCACELLKCFNGTYQNIEPSSVGLFGSAAEGVRYAESNLPAEGVSYVAHIKTLMQQEIASEITLFKHQNQEHVYLVAFQQNLGNMNKVLDALRHSEMRFFQMTENITEGIVILERDQPSFFNSAVTDIIGYSKNELKDIDEIALACDFEKSRVQEFVRMQQIQHKAGQSLEFWINTKFNQQKYIRITYTYGRTNSNVPLTYMLIADYTAQKNMQQALIKSQAEFKRLAENSPDMITRYDHDLTYSYVNKTVENVIGIKAEQLVGKNLMDINLDQNAASFIEEMYLETFRTGKAIKFEYRMKLTDGMIHVFQASMVPELTPDGHVGTVLNVSRDITQIKNAEREHAKEIQVATDICDQVSQNLKKWNNAIVDKFANYAQTDEMVALKRIAEWTGVAIRRKKITPRSVNINQALAKYFTDNVARVSAAGLELKLTLSDKKVELYSDIEVLTDIFDRLLDNAIENLPTGSVVEIGYNIYTDREIMFFVSDNGNGVGENELQKLFDPFYSTKNNHAGLGLPIAQKNIQIFKGRMWAESDLGYGLRIMFTHPATISQSIPAATITSVSLDVESQWSDKKILMVDDTIENFTLVEALLKKNGNPQLTHITDGKSAIEYVKNHPELDLVLMDIQLPDTNGYEVTKAIRQFNTTLPIIAHTAYAVYADVVKALDSGCNDFVAKPIKVKKMLSVLSKFL